ncbi:hypothetical protein DFH27DRAFT_616754 [Peziza echinospora]|nr:hypothetical protein DFH27DRAFT_616754 [Peziza echinospora]
MFKRFLDEQERFKSEQQSGRGGRLSGSSVATLVFERMLEPQTSNGVSKECNIHGVDGVAAKDDVLEAELELDGEFEMVKDGLEGGNIAKENNRRNLTQVIVMESVLFLELASFVAVPLSN